VKDAQDADAWRDFHRLYAPLLYRYARRRGLCREDAEEVRDQCMEIVTREMARFDYRKEKGGFKNWLRRMVENRVIDLIRRRREPIAKSGELRAMRDSQLGPAELWERQWRDDHLRYSLERVRRLVPEKSYLAFRLLLFDGCGVDEVEARLGLNANQVYKAKSRVLRAVACVLTEVDCDSIV
jgi:RNA polymerase sigma-70 factor (ECF subfamily)